MLIAHVSEFLDTADPAFVHSVGMAVRSGASVRGLHVARSSAPEPSPPNAYGLLARWGRPTVLFDHGWLTAPASEHVVDALLGLIARVQPALVVASTHSQSSLERLMLGSVAEGVARGCGLPALLLPHHGPFLVSAQSGEVTLDRILVLAGSQREAEVAAQALVLLTALAGVSPCTVEWLHSDDGTPAPEPSFPPGFDVRQRRARGPIERAVAQRVAEFEPQLVVMATRGHDQLSDVLFSSHTERVLHAIRRPVLSVPLSRGE